MLPLAVAINYSSGLPLIIAAGIAAYIASKALTDALVNNDPRQTGRLALGQWLPIASLCLTAAAGGRYDVAVGLIFSTSVACLSLAIGSVAALGPFSIPATARKTWPLLIPTGLLAFLAGFQSTVSAFTACVLALQGFCVLLVWNDPAATCPAGPLPDNPTRPPRYFFRSLQVLLAISLAIVGAWLALHGIDQVVANSEFASAGLLSATLLSPLLVLPIIGTGTEMAHHEQSAAAVNSHVGVALLNASTLLPLVVLTSFLRQLGITRVAPKINLWIENHPAIGWLQSTLSFIPRATTGPAPAESHTVPFPLTVWRVDIVIFIALGMFLLPIALGRWSLSRRLGAGLLLSYLLYLSLSILLALRRF